MLDYFVILVLLVFTAWCCSWLFVVFGLCIEASLLLCPIYGFNSVVIKGLLCLFCFYLFMVGYGLIDLFISLAGCLFVLVVVVAFWLICVVFSVLGVVVWIVCWCCFVLFEGVFVRVDGVWMNFVRLLRCLGLYYFGVV